MGFAPSRQQPTLVQMPPQIPIRENIDQPSTSMMMSTTPVEHGQGVVIATGTQNDPHQRNKAAIFGFGIGEIVMGGLSILLTIITISIAGNAVTAYWNHYISGSQYYYRYSRPSYLTDFTYSSPGIWGGIFIMVTGILAVRIKSNPSRCMYIANMIMAIITACFTFASTIMSGIAAGISFFSSALVAVHVIITLLNFVSFIISIIHAAFCCRGVCCKNNIGLTQQSVMYIPNQPNMMYPSQPQYVQGPNGQVLLASVQHIPAQAYAQGSGPIPVMSQSQQVDNAPPQIMQPPSYDNANFK